MKFIKYSLLLFVFVSCNSPRVVYDYDEKAAFTQIKTYQIYPDLVSNLNQLDEQRLVSILGEQLFEQGMVSSENPQIYVNFYAQEFQTPNENSLGVGIGGTGRNMGVGVSGGIPLGGPDNQLRLTLDFIDAQKDALLWQAVIEGKFNKDTSPQNREARLRSFIEKALKKYPPGR